MTTKISGDNISAIANTGVTWQSITVADGSTTLNAEAGKGYILDTNAGEIEVVLPSSPSRGDTVIFTDYSGTFATNRVLLNTNGGLLDSTEGQYFTINTNNITVSLVYIDINKGWLIYKNESTTTPSSALEGGELFQTSAFISATGGTITTVGTDYKVHTFTGDGCFVVSQGIGPVAKLDYLVIAGGGGGGNSNNGGGQAGAGGGGAGGYRESHCATISGPYTASPLASSTSLPISVGTYPVTVGGGGANISNNNPTDRNGSDSIFSTITSTGGGGGQTDEGCNPAGPGGSGGGGGGQGTSNGVSGTGNTPPVTPPQGNDGGTGGPTGGGGGGGAGVAGTNAGNPRGNGGDGSPTEITGSAVSRAGGGGAGQGPGSPASPGGAGGGGTGGPGCTSGTNGSANTGGGGGGAGDGACATNASSGGSGIVVLRYKFQ